MPFLVYVELSCACVVRIDSAHERLRIRQGKIHQGKMRKRMESLGRLGQGGKRAHERQGNVLGVGVLGAGPQHHSFFYVFLGLILAQARTRDSLGK